MKQEYSNSNEVSVMIENIGSKFYKILTPNYILIESMTNEKCIFRYALDIHIGFYVFTAIKFNRYGEPVSWKQIHNDIIFNEKDVYKKISEYLGKNIKQDFKPKRGSKIKYDYQDIYSKYLELRKFGMSKKSIAERLIINLKTLQRILKNCDI